MTSSEMGEGQLLREMSGSPLQGWTCSALARKMIMPQTRTEGRERGLPTPVPAAGSAERYAHR